MALEARAHGETGQAALLMLGVLAALLGGTLVLFGFGQALGARGHAQRAADLAAISAAQVMRREFPRLFEPPPRRLSEAAYLALARAAALRGARRNGAAPRRVRVIFARGGLAPTRVTVRLREHADTRPGRVEVSARATAELAVDPHALGLAAEASGGGYSGPLAYRQGKPMRPDVARAFDRLAAEARTEAGLALLVISGYRSDAEQARLFAAHPDPSWVAPPGRSLHRFGTELDLGPPSAYAWLAANAGRFGFVKRYAWEPWHFGYTLNAASASVGFGAGERPAGGLPAFVPAAYRETLARAAQRWNVGAALLAAQLDVESGFDPNARSPAGAQGIAQFMPGTAAALGLDDRFDPHAAIDAQAHLMRDLLRRFASVPLALAAYNAGPGSVAACMCIPPYPETQSYVAKILGLLGGIGDIAPPGMSVRLVE
jgi:soluble lytic murein transglycosylase-like protein